MEKWKLAVIAALLCSFAGYGWLLNTPHSTTNGAGAPPLVTPTTFTPPAPSKYDGQTIPSLSGIKTWANTKTPVDFSTYRGHPILFEVFRTECEHCQDAAPFLAQLHARYAPRGVEFLAVQSASDNPEPNWPEKSWPAVQTWIKDKGYTWPVGFDPNRAWFKKSYGNDVFYPSLFLLDKTGKIVFFQSGHTDAKAIELSVQLERIAPGTANAPQRATDLVNWMMNATQTAPDPQTKTDLQKAISSYLATKPA